MKIYLVGGAVRDELLNLPHVERDWVVVGETQLSMLAAGYRQVGKDFPVFLHPKTKEEYALARKERKVAQGYHGFIFDTDASVTLEEDLSRRDLTINAMAKDQHGHIIDPYHGADDLQKKILRHVSPAFIEDPVRILRVARFAARFSDFSIALETQRLMKEMVEAGEVKALVAERVWKEFEKAMMEVAPWRFLEVLDDCGALNIIFPLFQKNKINIVHWLKTISPLVRNFHERIILILYATHSLLEIKNLCDHYRAPKFIFEMVSLLLNYQHDYKKFLQLSAETLLDFFHALDAFRRPKRFKEWITLCDIISPYQAKSYLWQLFESIEKITIPEDFLKNHHGKIVGEYIEKQRLEKLKTLLIKN